MDNRLTRLIIIITILSSFFLLVYYYFYLIFPFILAAIITLYIEPIVSFIELKLKIKRIWSTILVISSFIILCTFFLFTISKLLLDEATTLIYHARDYIQSFKQLNIMIDAFVQTITDWFIGTFPFLSNLNDFSFQSYGDELIEATITSMMAMIQTSIRSITVIIQSFTQTLTILIITFIATCMMVYDYYFLKERVLNYVPDKLISKLKQLY
ncbi:MAG TPA: AI-2E family transporter, partial [Pseudogracilibacillus sp.]|nr:AI-2E family transporter [Pseudogracilibacillus sp.]